MTDLTKQFLTELRTVNASYRTREVLENWLELTAKNLHNTILSPSARHDVTALNDRFSGSDHAAFQRMWTLLREMFNHRLDDHLGKLFMDLGHGDASFGQFFTPFDISRLLAAMNKTAMIETLQDKGFLRLAEPAAGSGGMIIAALDVIKDDDHGFNYTTSVFIDA